MKTIPEMAYSTFLISSKDGSHRGLEGVVEVRMFSNILEASSKVGLLYTVSKSPSPIIFISDIDVLKKYHFTNTPNSRENSELKSDSKKLDFEYKEALRKPSLIYLIFI